MGNCLAAKSKQQITEDQTISVLKSTYPERAESIYALKES